MLSKLNPEAVFAPLAAAGKLVLAVSGGPDSVALMLLARRWSGNAAASVATIDHGLRAASRAEAEQVGQWAAALGFRHALLHWEGEKPRTRLQEQARLARYSLLSHHARSIGAAGIVTAHHADDQAETVLFRLARGSGVAGLSGMRAVSVRDGLKLWRPLLGVAKPELVGVCEAAGHPYLLDPSNHNTAFARVRLRGLASLLAQQGLTNGRLAKLAERAAAVEDALDASVQRARAAWHCERSAGYFSGDARFLAGQPEEIARRLLTAEILAVTGSQEALRLERLERAWKELHPAATAGQISALNLGGAALRTTRAGRLIISREGARKRGAAMPRAPDGPPPQMQGSLAGSVAPERVMECGTGD